MSEVPPGSVHVEHRPFIGLTKRKGLFEGRCSCGWRGEHPYVQYLADADARAHASDALRKESDGAEPTHLNLGELIDHLTADLAVNGDRRVFLGFHNPHSYRGFYEQLAFEPAENVLVSDMLADAKRALGSTYGGWKGGAFTMTKWTDCWLAHKGSAGESIGRLFLSMMLLTPPPSGDQEATDG